MPDPDLRQFAASLLNRAGVDFLPEDVTKVAAALAVLEGTSERGDVLAYLERRIANHDKVVASRMDLADRATLLRRELAVVRDHIEAGLHEGDAQVAGILEEGSVA